MSIKLADRLTQDIVNISNNCTGTLIIEVLRYFSCSGKDARLTEAYNFWFEHRGEEGVNYASVAIKFSVKPRSLTARASKQLKKLGMKEDGRKKRNKNSIDSDPKCQASSVKTDSPRQTPGQELSQFMSVYAKNVQNVYRCMWRR